MTHDSARRRAVALRYDAEQHAAPKVVARGDESVADRILALARESGVPVREDADLVDLLSHCDVGQEIPSELFAVVAELLVYLHRLNGECA